MGLHGSRVDIGQYDGIPETKENLAQSRAQGEHDAKRHREWAAVYTPGSGFFLPPASEGSRASLQVSGVAQRPDAGICTETLKIHRTVLPLAVSSDHAN